MIKSLKYFDRLTFLVILLLAVFGVIMIYSAGHSQGADYWLRQLLFLFVALIFFIIVFFIDLKFWFSRSLFLYLLIIVLLLLQLFFGRYIAGTKAWFRIGSFGLQVSEFVKIFLALYLAKYLTQVGQLNWIEFSKIALLILIPVVLIILQPDFGVSLILCSFFCALFFLKRIKKSIIVVVLLGLITTAYSSWHYYLKPYQKNRIISFLNPEADKTKSGYQVWQSKIALGSGGLWGRGYLQGTQSQFQFLPVRHNDFILALVGEELGFFGISIVLFLFLFLIYRQIFFYYTDDEHFYFVLLFNFLLFFQFAINALMVTGFFPVIGIPVPFVSYGGSSLLSFFIGEAIIFRIKFNAHAAQYS